MLRTALLVYLLINITCTYGQSRHLPFSNPELQFKIKPDEVEHEVTEQLITPEPPQKKIEKGKDREVISYYRYDKLVSKAIVKNGVTVQSIIYYGNGNIQQEIPYRNNLIHGIKKYYYPNGTLMVTTTYVNGEREGNRTIYLDKYNSDAEKIYAEIPYKANRINGLVKSYDVKRGEYYLRYEAQFKDGKAHGKWTTYERELRPLSKNRNERYSIIDTYKISEENFSMGTADGKHTDFYYDGTIRSVKYYSNGIPLKEDMYDTIGNVVHTNRYVKGKAEGMFKRYDEQGYLASEMTYMNGHLHGNLTRYHSNGKPRHQVNYHNDVITGRETTFHSNGFKESERQYNAKGNKVGTETLYSMATGFPKIVTEYDSAGIPAAITYFDEYTGKKTQWVKNDSQGLAVESSFFDTTGNIIWTNRFHKTKPIGIYRNYIWGKLDMQQYKDAEGNGYTFYYGEFSGKITRKIYQLANKTVTETEFLERFEIVDGIPVKR